MKHQTNLTKSFDNNQAPRKGCIDMWNAFMVDDARFALGSDIPFCPCTTRSAPHLLVSFVDAKHLHKCTVRKDPDYHINAFVHFYIDDQKFDGPRNGIWSKPYEALELLRHFSGVITPDFSTNADFPDSIKRYNTYRMRAFGFWLTTHEIPVINNVRWGTEETWDYCFDGIPCNSIVSIGTVASGIHKLENRPDFEIGLFRMVEVLQPHTIIVYGSANYECFEQLANRGVHIIAFPSATSLAYKNKKGGPSNVETE